MKLSLNQEEVEVFIKKKTPGMVAFEFNGKDYCFKLKKEQESEFILEREAGSLFSGLIARDEKEQKTHIGLSGENFEVVSLQGRRKESAAAVGSLKSPMPGKIFKVLVKEGQKVKTGEALIIVEAMKMEHTIKSNKDGVIKKIFFQEGQQVQGQVLLAEIE